MDTITLDAKREKKSFFDGLDAIKEMEAYIAKIADYDMTSAQAIIGMMIDTLSAEYGTPSAEIAETICSVVKDVNDTLGAYDPTGKEFEEND